MFQVVLVIRSVWTGCIQLPRAAEYYGFAELLLHICQISMDLQWIFSLALNIHRPNTKYLGHAGSFLHSKHYRGGM